MTVDSFKGAVNTNGVFSDVSTLTGVTFTPGNVYTIQIRGGAFIKIADAEFEIPFSTPFPFKQGSEDLKIRTSDSGAIITILENE